jgi:hypothetical protein
MIPVAWTNHQLGLRRDPWDASPPLRPAAAASSRFCEKLRFSFGTLSPPLRAISRCLVLSMDANPRLDFPLVLCASDITLTLQIVNRRSVTLWWGKQVGVAPVPDILVFPGK